MLANVMRRKSNVDLSLLYNEGFREDDWIEGFTSGGSQSKQSDHFLFNVTNNGNERAYVRNDPFELTDIDNIEVEWEASGFNSVANAYLIASGTKLNDHDSFNARLEKLVGNGFGRQISVLDVSALIAPYYVRVHLETSGITSSSSTLKVYRIQAIL